MRLITILGIVDEVGPHEYRANETTRFSVSKGMLGGMKHK
jgi:hypothetical protein